MRHRRFRTVRANDGLLLLLATVLVMGVVQFFVVHQRAFLNLYFLPVVLGAYRLGPRRSVPYALFAVLIATTVMLTSQGLYPGGQSEWWMSLLDFGTWGGILVLTAYLVGSLSEQRQQRLAEIHHAHEAVLGIMVSSVDHDTRTHSSRVADYSVEVARTMGLSEADVEDIRVGAWLHDIGNVESSMAVLRKAASANPEEFEAIGRYEGARDGDENLGRSKYGIFTEVIPMVTCHHERWDGTGYRHLTGNEIPLGARIIAVANTFDTIVTDGPYRESKTHAEAIKVIQRECGQAFDPRVVDAFLKHRTVPTERLTVLPRTYIRRSAEVLPVAGMNGSGRLHAARTRSMTGGPALE